MQPAPGEIRVRPVTLGEAAAVARIYNHHVTHTIVTFEEEVVAENEIVNRIFEVQSAARAPAAGHRPWRHNHANRPIDPITSTGTFLLSTNRGQFY